MNQRRWTDRRREAFLEQKGMFYGKLRRINFTYPELIGFFGQKNAETLSIIFGGGILRPSEKRYQTKASSKSSRNRHRYFRWIPDLMQMILGDDGFRLFKDYFWEAYVYIPKTMKSRIARKMKFEKIEELVNRRIKKMSIASELEMSSSSLLSYYLRKYQLRK
jgi:hypothetical protein